MERLLVDPITETERLDAEDWYRNAYLQAQRIAEWIEGTPEMGACILSAFSIRTSWERNVIDAWNFAHGEYVQGLEIRRALATASLTAGFDAFKAPKTNAFARAIAGDTDAVVIDVWMCRAAGINRDAPSVVQYRNIAKAVATLAKRHDMAPRDMQALIWGRVRGSMV
jgi:hypothetical protein